jgi:NAD(P)-dependent dehydrogenase (short-subunit alcohol dehydrogenase family)
VAVNSLKNDELARDVVAAIGDQGGTAVAVRADLSRRAGVLDLFDRAEQALGGLDIVVANHADVVIKPLIECTEEDFDRLFAVNAKGVFITLQEAPPDRDRAVAAGTSPFARVGQPEDVADVAVFLAGDEARWVTGQNVAVSGGVF